MLGATTSMNIENILKEICTRRRFQPVMVGEPSIEDTIEILKAFENVMSIIAWKITDDALEVRHTLEIAIYLTDFCPIRLLTL